MKAVKALLLAILSIIMAPLVNSFVIFKLWNWIVVPILKFNEIHFSVSFGICVIIFFITDLIKDLEVRYITLDEAYTEIKDRLAMRIISAIYYLIIGFIAKDMLL